MVLIYDKLVLFGDSLTEYSTGKGTDFSFQGSISDDYMRRLDVENRAYSGYTTRQARLLLPEILNANIGDSKIKLMTMCFGCNDSSRTFYVPIEEYEENLEYLSKEILKRDVKLVLMGPGLHDSELLKRAPGVVWDGPVNSNKNLKNYSEAAKRVALKLNIPFVDMWNAFRKHGNWSEEELLADKPTLDALLVDGIHYTAEAYRVLYKEVTHAIVTGHPELSPHNIPRKLPEWEDCDIDKVRQALLDLAK